MDLLNGQLTHPNKFHSKMHCLNGLLTKITVLLYVSMTNKFHLAIDYHIYCHLGQLEFLTVRHFHIIG